MARERAEQKRARIALDAMGGDYGPVEVVKGAVEAARTGDVEIILVGDREAVQAEMAKHGADGLPIRILPSRGKISDDEQPALGLRRNPQASIAVATALVERGEADAVVTMGNTGAAMASAALLLGTMEGLERPALGGPFMGLAPRTVLLDLGASVDCRPSQLLSFAVLGSVFARRFLEIPNPRVALLSIGAEPSKGNRQVRESHELFRRSGLNFVGNVEGMDLFTDKADVIVCDGFVGNIVLKFAEGMAAALYEYVRQHTSPSLLLRTLEPMASALWELVALGRKTGGPVFGVNGVVVVGHGASRADAIVGSVATARRCLECGLVEGMREELVRVHARIAPG